MILTLTALGYSLISMLRVCQIAILAISYWFQVISFIYGARNASAAADGDECPYCSQTRAVKEGL